MISSLREATRSLVRTPLFTGVAASSIGIGTGLAASVFAVAHAVFFTPPPYREADQLVEVWQTERPGSPRRSDYLLPDRALGWARTSLRHVKGLAGAGMSPARVLESDGAATRVAVKPVVGDWFGILGTPALLGRVLTPDDERPGAEAAMVVSWTFWKRHLGARAEVVGEVVDLSGTAFTIVGVMPRRFSVDGDVWVPAEALPSNRQPVAYLGIARLRPGSTQLDARTEFEGLAAAQVAEDSLRWGGFGATVVPMDGASRSTDDPALWILIGVVVLVLLIGLSNLTTLFLVRAQERSVSLAIRASLGASSWQLGRGLLSEASLLGLFGSGLGIVFTFWGTKLASALILGGAAPPPEVGAATLLVAIVVAVFVTMVVGLEPLRRLRLLDLLGLLQRRAAGAGGTKGERRSREVILAVQVALCVVLVALLGLFGSAYRAYLAIDPGYDAERLVRAAPDWEITGMDEAAQWSLAREISDRVRGDPAVEGVALWHPMMGAWPPRPEYAPVVEGAPEGAPTPGSPDRIDPGFLRAVGIPLLRGRAFTDADDTNSPYVIIVSQDAADAWWPERDPLGQRIKFARDAPWMTVVGVVAPSGPMGRVGRGIVHIMSRQHRILPRTFVPARQWLALPPGWRTNSDCEQCRGVSIAVRATGEVASAERALRSALQAVAPALPLNFLTTVYDQQMHGYEALQIIPPARMVGAGVIAGLFLALLGVVGLVADGVARRRWEIGVRMALGAPAGCVLVAVARDTVTAGLVGLGAGILALTTLHNVIPKFMVDRQIRSLTPALLDPGLLAGAAAVVLGLTLVAALVTATRALRVDPAEALRSAAE